ncbi:MAG: beta-N-acetylhexosaminidase [Acidobacteriota bacterium]
MSKSKKNAFIVLLVSLLTLIIIFTTILQKDNKISIIPKPDMITETGDGYFTIDDSTIILVDKGDGELKRLAEYFSDMFSTPSGIKLKTLEDREDQKNSNRIILTISKEKKTYGDEGYSLEVEKDFIKITASKGAGIFYGIQTLRQLLPAEIESKTDIYSDIQWEVPFVQIEDAPQYKWRGMMLDTCRHFMPLKFIKEFIDHLAMYKLNKFHWHLTEDQGWRIEIKKYPELSEISAWRKETVTGHARDIPSKYDGKKHGGIYTQDEIREVIEYAKERYITIIPEIEMPGHSVAALAAFPQISCTGGPFEVKTIWGVHEDVYCAGKEETFTFLEDVLTEVIELFPSEYIHIGGDECPKERWKKCPDCQARIEEEGLKDEHELQSYFIKRIERFLNSKGKKLIGWDEILEGGLAPEATVMSWRGTEGGIAAARAGHDVIMSPTSHCYFDYYQGNPENEPLAIGGLLTLEKVYSFNPTPDILKEEERKHILGGQANLWTEYIPNPEQAEYMIFPRIAALAEVVWTTEKLKKWSNFSKRMKKQYRRFQQMDINYHGR